MRAVMLLCWLAPAAAYAAPATAVVEATWSRDAGDVIVTESRVRRPDGSTVVAIQLGGVVDGIGMTFSHVPPPPHVGDLVELGTGNAIVAVHASARVAPVETNALYGVVHTRGSGRPVWQPSACTTIVYGDSVSAGQASVIDRAFDTWAATELCTPLVFTRRHEAGRAAAIDGVSSIHVRRDRWCRPATASEPELCYAPEATAVTRLRFVDDATDPDDGRILEADVELNAVDFEILGPGDPATTSRGAPIDLQSVATHEIGHLLGLAHSCGTGTEAWPRDHAGRAVPACDGLDASAPAFVATMYFQLPPSDAGQRTLEASDLVGLCSLTDELVCEYDEVQGGCATGRPTGLVAIVIVSWLRRRRR